MTSFIFDIVRFGTLHLMNVLKPWTGCPMKVTLELSGQSHYLVFLSLSSNPSFRCLQADDWRILSAADDKMIKVWNLGNDYRLKLLVIFF